MKTLLASILAIGLLALPANANSLKAEAGRLMAVSFCFAIQGIMTDLQVYQLLQDTFARARYPRSWLNDPVVQGYALEYIKQESCDRILRPR
ncbi:hypothetical protein VZG28_04845 [Synechococcus elongatus IITB4]|uniref:hypothetical protein n=1 Tax=Synechococcus elongatus TaxID=32046 RepID=UPI0030CD9DCE